MFRSVGNFLLHTGPTSSLRHILYNGWGLEKDEVLAAFTTLANISGVLMIFPIACTLHRLWGIHYYRLIMRAISRIVKERARSQGSPSTTEVEV